MNTENLILELFRKTVYELAGGETKEKATLLLDKFEDAESIKVVLDQLKKVKGFVRLSLYCDWIIEKYNLVNDDIKLSQEDFTKFRELLVASLNFSDKTETKEIPQPKLIDLIDRNLFTGFQRFTDIVKHLANKSPQERKTTFGVLAMISKSSLDVAKKQNNKMIEEFFEAVLKFIINVDKFGTANNSKVTDIMKNVGEELTLALNSNINPKESFAKVITILQEPIGSAS
ncbi:MAG: hypothetical protein O3A55_07580 [Bacteroidetes bacterium]|nr:hypothetical protein [Bacteroidota bacterium]